MEAKKQVLVIHGGDFFDSRQEFVESLKKEKISLEDLIPGLKKNWKDALSEDLGDGYEVLQPKMPLAIHARYEEWKIWFEKIFLFLKDGAILVGHSLGGIFLVRYLGENDLPVKARALFLVAPYFGARTKGGEESAGWTVGESLEKLQEQIPEIFIYHSDDDQIVPVAHAEKYKALLPKARFVAFKDKGHFRLERFPELAEAIKGLK